MQLKFRDLAGPVTLLLLISCSSCTFLKQTIGLGISRPVAKVKQVTLKEISFDGLSLDVEILVYNPNDFDISMSELSYSTKVSEYKLASGEYQEAIEIKSEQNKSVTIPVKMDFTHSVNIARTMLKQPDSVNIEWLATATFETMVGPITISFKDTKPLSK